MVQSTGLRLPKIQTMRNMLPIDPSKLCVRKMKKKEKPTQRLIELLVLYTKLAENVTCHLVPKTVLCKNR